MQVSRRHQQGLSLVELMIAVLLGALILAGTVMLFQQSKSSSVQDEQIARMQENGRFALRTLARELAMMGYWGGMLSVDDSTKVDATAATASADCLAGGWVFKLSPITTYPAMVFSKDLADSPYTCISFATEIKAGTDMLAIKRVADQPSRSLDVGGNAIGTATATVKDTVYFKTNTVLGAFFVAGGTSANGPGFVPNPSSIYQYFPSIIYVRPYSTVAGDGIPTLVRETLVEDAMMAQPLSEGIEDMQIEFGIDGTDTDLAADFYTPDPTASDISNAVSARVYLLVRSINPVTGYINDKTYNLGSKAIAAANDAYYRRVYSTTVQLRNSDKLKLYALN